MYFCHMIDVAKQVEYWRKGGEEDWAVGSRLVKDGNVRHGLFLAHLAIEKVIKAHICRATKDLAPKMHNLLGLMDKTGLSIPEEDAAFLADLNQYNIEGRYPEMYGEPPSPDEANKIIATSGRILAWLLCQL
jgi:HEPN domain-containing protein